MTRAQISKWHAQVSELAGRYGVAAIERPLQRLRERALKRWIGGAFRDFVPVDGDRQTMLASLLLQMNLVQSVFDEWTADQSQDEAFARVLLDVSVQIDDGRIRHKDQKLKSYVDVSLQVQVLRLILNYLSSTSRTESLALTPLLLKHFPDSRIALLVHAELLLESGEADEAVEVIQRALRIQAVCQTAQQLLFAAYRAKRAAGSNDDALKVLDYDLKDRFCVVPFRQLSTGFAGNAHACSCPAWVPFPIGNILQAESADAVWNSAEAVEIRRSILDGDFSYCSRTLCSFITAQKLPRKDEITDPVYRGYIEHHTTTLAARPNGVDLNYDNTCNLACPSCRTEIQTASVVEQASYAKAQERVILPLLKEVKGQVYISGGGEVFSSRHGRSVLSSLNRQEYPGVDLHLITNAQLLTPLKWNDFPHLPEMIGTLSVSIDAANAESYEKLRWPGKWSTLMTNLEFISEMRREERIREFWINFVVQKENFRQMLDFVELGMRLGVDRVWFQRVTNYGAYDEATFADIDVTSPQHPDHAELLEILRSPLLHGPRIQNQMLISLLPERVNSDERWEFLY